MRGWNYGIFGCQDQNLRAYASRFEGLLAKLSSYDHAWALDQFVTGLPARIAELVTIAEVPTLSQAIRKAEAVELSSRFISRAQ